MNSFDESDEWFPAVGESDGYFTDEPGHVSEPGDEEGMFFPYVDGHPAMVDDGEDEGDLGGVVNDVDLGQPAPNTPVAFLPVQNSISPNTSSSSLSKPLPELDCPIMVQVEDVFARRPRQAPTVSSSTLIRNDISS